MLRFEDVAAEPLWRGVSFTAHAGELVAVTGPPGSGKTLLLMVAGGYLAPTSGVIVRPTSVAGLVVAVRVPHAGGDGTLEAGLLPPGSLVLVDDPTVLLDGARACAARQLVADLAADHVVVCATHDAELTAMATRVVAL